MLVRCTFEELVALGAAAERTLAAAALVSAGSAPPPEELVDVELLLPRLTGDLDLDTLADQRRVFRAVDLILERLRERVDATILEQYVGAEDAILAYFDYANVLTFHERLRRAGDYMEAMIELMTGEPATEDAAHEVTFPE